MTVRTWNGGSGSTNNWSDSSNWGVTGVPVAGDDIHFAGSARTSPINNLAADLSFASITFDSGAAAFSITGARVTLTGSITNNSANAQSVGLAVILSGTVTATATAAGTLTLAGVISGSGNLTVAAVGTNLYITATNTFSGVFTVPSTSVNHVYVDGSGTINTASSIVVNNTGSSYLRIRAAASLTYPQIISGTGWIYFETGVSTILTAANSISGRIGFTGILQLGAGFTTGSINPSVLVFGGLLSFNRTNTVTEGVDFPTLTDNTISVAQNGSGDLVFTGTQTYLGTTSVFNGRMIVNGSLNAGSAVTVSGGALIGTGTINGPISVASGGTLGPNFTGVTRGTLTTAGVTFTAGAVFNVSLDGATPSFDKINSSGTVALASATLTVSSMTNGAGGKVYTIIAAATSVTGTFNGLANNATISVNGRTLRINYNANSVTLTDTAPAGPPVYAMSSCFLMNQG